MALVCVFPVSRYESVSSMVKDIQEPLMERQSSPEYGGKHYVVLRHSHLSLSERCGDSLLCIGECLRYLESLIFTNAHDVVSEEESVFLIVAVSYFSKVHIGDAVCVAKVHNLHIPVLRYFFSDAKITKISILHKEMSYVLIISVQVMLVFYMLSVNSQFSNHFNTQS